MLFSWNDHAHHQNAGFTRDIGTGGVFIFARACPPRGSRLKVEIVVPLSKETGREIRLRCVGEVIRVELGSPYSQDGFAVAGDFGNPDEMPLAQA